MMTHVSQPGNWLDGLEQADHRTFAFHGQSKKIDVWASYVFSWHVSSLMRVVFLQFKKEDQEDIIQWFSSKITPAPIRVLPTSQKRLFRSSVGKLFQILPILLIVLHHMSNNFRGITGSRFEVGLVNSSLLNLRVSSGVK